MLLLLLLHLDGAQNPLQGCQDLYTGQADLAGPWQPTALPCARNSKSALALELVALALVSCSRSCFCSVCMRGTQLECMQCIINGSVLMQLLSYRSNRQYSSEGCTVICIPPCSCVSGCIGASYSNLQAAYLPQIMCMAPQPEPCRTATAKLQLMVGTQ